MFTRNLIQRHPHLTEEQARSLWLSPLTTEQCDKAAQAIARGVPVFDAIAFVSRSKTD
jgi:hypothetical protein